MLKLGLKPPRNDVRTLMAARYMAPDLPEPPESVDYTAKVHKWGMLLNDQLGCCGPAAACHGVQLSTANANQERVPSDSICLEVYRRVGGYDPRNPGSDQGVVYLDLLNDWIRNGVHGHKITGYVQINHRDIHAIKTALHLFGDLQVGFAMPDTWQQMGPNEAWRAPTDARQQRGRWAKNPANGHAMTLGAYDNLNFGAVTWGRVQKLSHNWVTSYATEIYARLSTDWFNKVTKMAPSGANWTDLQADLAKLRAA